MRWKAMQIVVNITCPAYMLFHIWFSGLTVRSSVITPISVLRQGRPNTIIRGSLMLTSNTDMYDARFKKMSSL
jgi:hypothetical protein